ncbi:DMT family transporter [Biostraticola tofi]|uniref:Threonine/homoserine efflux transporter RhtA n=1 Tax=Biostraticola tofi TaxID=466109 RepID=A0A4R3Z573_9GAMM|nr:DMT family transporter [Biostraticola tofi]TCW00353.1 threonine/homoserine efflux transporter RhtA [Biostraticola tofi]
MTFFYPLVAVLLWSVNAIVSKMAAGLIDPGAISFYRWLLAFLLMTPFVLPGVWRNRAAVKHHAWRLFILGLLGMVLYQSLAYYAAHSVTALFIGILNSLIPLLTVLLSILLLGIAPTLGVLLGALLSLVGLVWLISEGHPATLMSQGIGLGELMMLAASTSYALYGVLTRRWSINLPNWQSLYVQVFFGVLLLLPGFLLAPDIALTPQNIPLVLFAGIAASLVAPFLWIQGVIRLGANTTSIFMYLAPVFTALIAILFLQEQLQAFHLVGGGITLAGVVLAQRLRIPLKRRQREKHKMR